MYLDYDEYIAINHGVNAIGEDEYPAFEEVAETIVDAFTFRVIKLRPATLELYSDVIKHAMAHQLSTMAKAGSLDAFIANCKAVQSKTVTVGETSETIVYAGDTSARMVNGLELSPVACTLLAPVRASGRWLA